MASEKWKVLERNLAKAIGKWWCGDSEAFARTCRSGAWPRKRSDGDIVGADPTLRENFPFTVDAKCRSKIGGGEWHLEQLLTAKKHPILAWWRDMNEMETVKRGNYRLLVICKTSGIGDALLIYGDRERKWFKDMMGPMLGLPQIRFMVGGSDDPNYPPELLTIVRLTAFFEYVDPEVLKTKLTFPFGVMEVDSAKERIPL